MQKILILLFSLFLTISCTKELPEEEYVTTEIDTDTINKLEPRNLSYDLTDLKFYANSPITVNKLKFNGDRNSIEFLSIPTLPLGLYINPENGNLEGTPTELKSKTPYTIRVKNAHGEGTIQLSIEVLIPPPKNLTYDINNISLVNGISIFSKLPIVSGVVDNYTISPSLPLGLILNSTTGEISGTPLILKERTSYVVKAYNSTGFTQFSFFMEIIDIAPENLTYDVIESTYMVNNEIVTNKPHVNGGIPSIYSIEPLSLPAGIFFNTTNGYIFGKPLAEMPVYTEYKITAINTGGRTSKIIKIKVEDVAPTIPVYKNNNVFYTKDIAISDNILICAGSDFSFTKCTSGGKPTFVSINPTLPDGLVYNQYTGVISGTPRVLTPQQDYTILVSNSGGTKIGTIQMGVKDKAPLNLRYRSNLFEIRKNESFSLPSPLNDGGEVIQYSIVSGNLPEGLVFNTTTGSITGTPTNVNLNVINVNIKGENTGGSFSFSVGFKILPIPYYNFSYKLMSKKIINSYIEYEFHLKNESIEYDNSKGISIPVPVSIIGSDLGVILNTNLNESNCLQFNNDTNRFEYLTSCSLKIQYPIVSSTPLNPIPVVITTSNVFTRNFDLRQYLDLTPVNLLLKSERGTIVKINKDLQAYPVNVNNISSFSNTNPIVSSLLKNELLGLYSVVNYVGNSIDNMTAIIENQLVNDDPDLDGNEGLKVFNNINFNNRLEFNGEFSGFNPVCSIEIPYTPLANCLLGFFEIQSQKINQTGKLKIKANVLEGLSSEISYSNEINVDVYEIKRIINTELYPKRIINYNNKIYFAGLVDGVSNNTRKLLSYQSGSSSVRQVSSFLSNGDDRPFPIIDYDGFLLLKGREPGTNYIKFYFYNENLDKITPLYLQSQIEAVNKEDEISIFKFQDKIFFPIEEKSSNTKFWVYYDKIANKFAKMFNDIPNHVSNGLVDDNGFVSYNNKLFFYSMVIEPNKITNGYKLQSIDFSVGEHKWVSHINNNSSDYLTNGLVYDNKIFYVTRKPNEPINSSLIYYDEMTNSNGEFVSIMSANANGTGEILGVAYGKLFFTLPYNDRYGLYYYDGSTRNIHLIFESKVGSKIKKIDRFSNLENKQVIYFIEEELQGNNLMKIDQKNNDLVIKTIVDGKITNLNKDLSMFNYNNTLFFSCHNLLESLCTYNEESETVAKVVDDIKLMITINPMGQKTGVNVLNNRIYFSSDRTSSGQKAGIFELCIKGSSSCENSL